MKCAVLGLFVSLVSCGASAQDEKCPVNPNVRGHENVEWSIAYAFHLTDAKKDLPRVLLVGDSICNGYQEGVQKLLDGKVNVSYWISSYCVTSPGYLKLLAFYLDEAKYDVVHFNNGLHTPKSTAVSAYANALAAALALIREKQPQARLVWATSTPLADEVKNAHVKELNAAALPVAEEAGCRVNDLFALLDPMDRAANWSDVYHHRASARKLESEQVAASVLAALLGRKVAVPRIILDSDRLDYVTFPQDQTEKLNSGWEMDGAAFMRPFNRQAAGVVRYGAVFALPADVSAELRFEDAKGNVLRGEKIVGGREQPVCGAFEQDGSLARVRLVPTKPVAPKGLLARPFRVTVDWAVDQDFTCVAAGALPEGWRGEKAAVVDLPYLGCTAKNGEKGFDRPATDAVLEIAPGGWVDPLAGDAGRSARGADPTVALLGESYAFEFDALVEDETDFEAAGVRLRNHYAFTPGIWYHFRFEVYGEKTLLKLNGRVIAQDVKGAFHGNAPTGDVPAGASRGCSSVNCTENETAHSPRGCSSVNCTENETAHPPRGCSSVNCTENETAHPLRGCSSVNCTIENLSKSAKLLVDDVKAFALVSPADYPPAPVRVKGEEKWDVIMNICSLWYNGRHAGWRCVECAGGPRPVLGYYDEGLPETADWEIKYMVDHGVDVQAFCWYPESHDGPIRHPRYEYQLRDGFKNARYSDRMRYCLIWEIENAGRPHTLEAWKKNYVPYLIEHHFKDPRYYAPDGKPMLAVFGGWNFPKRTAFGSPAETKAAFDYLEAELKKLGFKGLVTVSSNWHNGRDDLAACGFSARCAYNYGTEGWKVETQKTRNLARASVPGAFVIPTVSVGFNSRPWHGKTYPMMTAADLKTSLEWVRDEFIPAQQHAEPWQAKAVWLSTWNEYGEGTYMMPTDDALGFGYLDAVRSVFTDEPPDSKLNVRPTPAQRERLCYLYPTLGK